MGTDTPFSGRLVLLWASAMAFALVLLVVSSAQAATALYPDLETLPPRELRFDRTDVSADGSGTLRNVLRFSNTVVNSGQGRLEMRGVINPSTKRGPAIERVYDSAGGYADYTASEFYYHAVHAHYHYDNWGRYQLWTKAGWDAYLASGRTQGQPINAGFKTTSCVVDEEFVKDLPDATPYGAYGWDGCQVNAQNLLLEGLSVGWGDTYDYNKFEQWIDLGQASLADGRYVLRSVTDPDNQIYESPGKADAAREGQPDNEATTTFSVQSGKIVDGDPPTGTVQINDVDLRTPSPNVTLKLLGRDDVSGADQVRLSNNGVNWSSAYTLADSAGSTRTSIAWNLSNATYGGTAADGTKTVYAQFHDRSGKWGPSQTDAIILDRGTAGSFYASAVLADSPVGFWRLGEMTGTSAADSAGSDTGTYRNGATQGVAGLVVDGGGNRAVALDGVNDYVGVPNTSALRPTARVSVEAWVNPSSLPSSGSFASIATKPESYSLQFNGPRLEFTIMQNGLRNRLQAPVGAIVVGQTYHVVGTYDGTTSRLYVNGTQVGQLALSTAIGSNAGDFEIGSWDSGSEFLTGTIDDVAVYGVALAAARVKAHYDAGVTASSGGVAAPSGLSATVASSSRIDLRWTDNATNETEYVLERDSSSSFSSPRLTSLAADTTSFADTGLAAGTTYYYRVRAKNATDSSGYSSVVNASTASPPTAYQATVAADAPVSYWRLGEASGTAAADVRGANQGLYANGPGLGSAGLLLSDPSNKAVTFDGVNDFVRVADSSSLRLGAPFSLEAWIKPSALPAAGSFASVLSKAESYSLQFNGPRLEFTVIQSGVRRRLQAPAGAVVTGRTYHVVGSYDAATQRLYLNGVEVASAPLSGAATTTSNDVFVGSWDGGWELFRGIIDEPAIFPTALPAARVKAHYDAGIASGT